MDQKPLSAEEAFDFGPANRVPGSKFSELARPEIQDWLQEALKRQREGRLSWAQAKVAINRLLAERGLPPITSPPMTLAAYTRRHYGG
jgi:hypothetical protein